MDEILLDLDLIKKNIQIRYPVLMVDSARVLPGEKAVGLKYLTSNEPFWQGHYPDYPMMPGTYQLECMAQTFSLIFLVREDFIEDKDLIYIPRLAGFDKCRFYREVKPGCILEMRTEMLSFKHGIAVGRGEGYVNNECVCSAEIKTKVY